MDIMGNKKFRQPAQPGAVGPAPGLQAILVKNATEDVRKHAIESLSATQMTERLYLPRGNFFGMNGHYAAGVLEGLAHFIPETENVIATAVAQLE